MLKQLIIPIGVVAILASMLLPLPPMALDFLLISNLILALLLLVTVFFISDSIKLSALPSMLLLATLFRLSLNVSSTRLILGAGEAGKAIEAFGGIVIQGNIIVGVVVFLIITLVQFIVIAKGSERVAEVSARFTLDALPGKQMSIDADVRAGLIDFESARRKREDLQIESRFYGALDGAMKFVKGDAIAGLVIVAVNIIGGLGIGLLTDGLDLYRALSKYTILTVGDGLLAQIPALLNSLAAGMVITRVGRADDVNLSQQLLSQLGQQNIVKYIIAGISFVLACLPGMPSLPFIVLALVLLVSGLLFVEEKSDDLATRTQAFEPRTPPVLHVEMGDDIAAAIYQNKKIDVLHQLSLLRQEIYEKYGLIIAMPEFAYLASMKGRIRINMRGVFVQELVAQPNKSEENLQTIFDCIRSLVGQRTTEFIDDILTRRTLDYFDKQSPELVSSVVPTLLSLTQLTSLLRNLAKEKINIRNFDLILQAVAETGGKANSERALLEEVRLALARVISQANINKNGDLEAYTLDPVLDLAFAKAERGAELMDLERVDHIANIMKNTENKILLASKSARRLISEVLQAKGLNVTVLAYEEIAQGIKITELGFIDCPNKAELVESLAA